ncbi:hypothetical protein C8R45DRAFT_1090347 [Mycena sanguinolenta]|nr:hypothetical protein C8R45DRAFT_1090347 [Mycena sanguinolenta]
MVFGTIYYSTLVYLTQKVVIGHAAQEYSLLTATHDKLLAWTGIGSAISTAWQQVKLPGSPLQILYISIYLATISVLHIATPALVSVESFERSLRTQFGTQGMPTWSNMTEKYTAALLLSQGGAFLPWVTNLDPALTLGLSNRSLYDVLESASLSGGPAEISAVGFNITCGYIPALADQDETTAYGDFSSPMEAFLDIMLFPPGKLLIPNSLSPAVQKRTSKWEGYSNISGATIEDESSLLEGNYWVQVLMDFETVDLLVSESDGDGLDWGSLYLMQQLGLNPAVNPSDHEMTQSIKKPLYLHDVENALAGLVSSISTALGASIVLLVLLPMFGVTTPLHNNSLTRLGFLEAIWVFENHPELPEILEQVEDPSDYNLRTAGLIKVRLLDAICDYQPL